MATSIVNGTHSVLGTDERLERLVQLERLGLTSFLAALTVDKLYEHEIAEAQSKLAKFEVKLAEFETQYEMASDDFFSAVPSRPDG